MRLLITGGCGFIGSNFIRHILKKHKDVHVTNLDKLTYCGNTENLKDIANDPRYEFVKGDICDKKLVADLVSSSSIVINFAAESHVDRSIKYPDDFYNTNIYGVKTLLEAARKSSIAKFVQISCYDEETRALTTDGLKTYKQVKKGDSVFTLNPETFEIEIKPIEKVIIQNYKGKMVHFNNQRIDLLVTPNHNMFILDTGKKRLLVERADKACRRSIFYMPNGQWRGKSESVFDVKGYGKVKTKDLMYILGIFIGDGFTAYQEKKVETKTGLRREEYLKSSKDIKTGKFKKIEKQSNYASTCHSYRIFLDIPENDKCRKRVEKTLHNLGVRYQAHKGKAGTHLYFTSKVFMRFFDQCGKGAHNKCIPRWALEYSPEYLKHLWQGLMDSDGSRNKIYYTVSKSLVSDFCELCLKLSLKPSIYKKHSVSFIGNRKIEGTSEYVFVANTTKSISRHKSKMVDYDGKIWCLKVKDNKNFLVERNGKLDFCGNTDEVYGSVPEGFSTEDDRLMPRSPYSASKAAGDLLALSYYTTYGMPVVVTRSSNNYGPFQYPEKVIPLFLTNLIKGDKIPLYGDGGNIRDWLYVEDNCRALGVILDKGVPGEIYNIGGDNQTSNLELTQEILKVMGKDESSIEYVNDRPGHDRRYALDSSKIIKMGWSVSADFVDNLKNTADWYKANEAWWAPLKAKAEIIKW